MGFSWDFLYISVKKKQQVELSGEIWVFVCSAVRYTVTGPDSLFSSQSAVWCNSNHEITWLGRGEPWL